MIPLSALNEVSAALGIPADWLNGLITFESAWNPAARNPQSGARGLIQFTHTTARGMGFDDADDLVNLYPTAEEQLRGPVLKYLRRYVPYPTEQSFYMAVFYPEARYWPQEKRFPDAVRTANPGIDSPADYARKVHLATGIKRITIGAVIGVAVLTVIFTFIKTRKG